MASISLWVMESIQISLYHHRTLIATWRLRRFWHDDAQHCRDGASGMDCDPESWPLATCEFMWIGFRRISKNLHLKTCGNSDVGLPWITRLLRCCLGLRSVGPCDLSHDGIRLGPAWVMGKATGPGSSKGVAGCWNPIKQYLREFEWSWFIMIWFIMFFLEWIVLIHYDAEAIRISAHHHIQPLVLDPLSTCIRLISVDDISDFWHAQLQMMKYIRISVILHSLHSAGKKCAEQELIFTCRGSMKPFFQFLLWELANSYKMPQVLYNLLCIHAFYILLSTREFD